MFGTYRFVLALLVALGHLGGIDNVGAYSVFGFYILSGYLMTLTMHTRYRYSVNGFFRFVLNRFLRIYPLYWISVLFSLALIAYFGPVRIAQYHHAMRLPDNWIAAAQNFFIVFPPNAEPRLTPPSWALSVELFFYLCIGLGLSRTGPRTVVWLAASIAYVLYVNMAGLSFEYKYSLIPAASLPFSTGAFIYLYKDRLLAGIAGFRHKFAISALFAMSLANYALSRKLGILDTWGFYVSYLLSALLIIRLSTGVVPAIVRRVDGFFGDFSYPIYLVHLQSGFLALSLGTSLARGQIRFFLASIPIVLVISWVLIKTVESPIELIRKKFKPSRSKSAPKNLQQDKQG